MVEPEFHPEEEIVSRANNPLLKRTYYRCDDHFETGQVHLFCFCVCFFFFG